MDSLKDLYGVLANLKPKLREKTYVYCEIDDAEAIDPSSVFALIREDEGTTLILTKDVAQDAGLAIEVEFACISLMVSTSLETVGLTATVATILTDANIPTNLIAAYHHDHLFVPSSRALDALALLEDLSKRAAQAAATMNQPEGGA